MTNYTAHFSKATGKSPENKTEFNGDLLKCLDFAQNPIVIFDKDAALIFANKAFIQTFKIDSLENAQGRTFEDIQRKSRLKIIYPNGQANPKFKMYEVLNEGKTVLDWNLKLESQTNPNDVQHVVTDMYPILDDNGNVKGMIEIYRSRQQELKRVRNIMGMSAEYTFDNIAGTSRILAEKIALAKEFASNSANILITGESGVGKELFAQSIHNFSSMCSGPFVALNCASFPTELIESELFGYVEGAFTGASKKGQIGKIELADGGTLFLDEIGELPYHFQSKLLRVLENWIITRIGGTKGKPVNVRLIAATNRNLEQAVSDGLFRRDLYYRLQVLNIEIPPLRQRREDISVLAEYFLRQSAMLNHTSVKRLDASAKQALEEYDWPGNGRELKNFISRIDILSKENTINRQMIESFLPNQLCSRQLIPSQRAEDSIAQQKKKIEEAYGNLLKCALENTGGNRTKAASLIGVSRKTFYRMMRKYLPKK